MTTSILRLPELTPSTAERVLTNTVTNQLEVFLGKVDDFLITTPPLSIPPHGYKAILGAIPTGIWSAYPDHIVLVVVDVYVFIPPSFNLPDQVSNITPGTFYQWDGLLWESVTTSEITWKTTNDVSINLTPNDSVVLTHTTLQSLTAPSGAPLYSVIKLRGNGAGGWTLTNGTFISDSVSGTTASSVGDYSSADFRLIALPDVWILDNPNTTVSIT